MTYNGNDLECPGVSQFACNGEYVHDTNNIVINAVKYPIIKYMYFFIYLPFLIKIKPTPLMILIIICNENDYQYHYVTVISTKNCIGG